MRLRGERSCVLCVCERAGEKRVSTQAVRFTSTKRPFNAGRDSNTLLGYALPRPLTSRKPSAPQRGLFRRNTNTYQTTCNPVDLLSLLGRQSFCASLVQWDRRCAVVMVVVVRERIEDDGEEEGDISSVRSQGAPAPAYSITLSAPIYPLFGLVWP